MEFRILGRVEAVGPDGPIALPGPRHRVLLAALLVDAQEVVPHGRLVDALWESRPPRCAREVLHVRVCELRAALGVGRGTVLLTTPTGYAMRISSRQLDAWRFEQLAADGRRAFGAGEYGRAGAVFAEALALWRGPALADVANRAFAAATTARLDAVRLQVLEDRLAADLALGRAGDLVGELAGLVAQYPLRERLWSHYIRALYRGGQQGEALVAYGAIRSLLADELGIDPGAELQRLHAAILRQNPA